MEGAVRLPPDEAAGRQGVPAPGAPLHRAAPGEVAHGIQPQPHHGRQRGFGGRGRGAGDESDGLGEELRQGVDFSSLFEGYYLFFYQFRVWIGV